jgi:uncharacterized protein (TIGR02118 family)
MWPVGRAAPVQERRDKEKEESSRARTKRCASEKQAMHKAVFGLNRQEGVDIEEFERHWREDHSPIAAETPGLRKYTISIAHDPEGSRYDGLAQLYFDSEEALEAAMNSEELGEAAADLANFADTEDVLQLTLEEGVQVEEH